MYQKLNKLFTSSSVYILGNVINRALFLISMPIMTRYLQSEQYGVLSIINAVTGIMMICYGLGAPNFIMRYYYEYDSANDRKYLLGSIISYVLIFTFLISILLTVSGDLIFNRLFKDIPFSPYMLLGIWICFFSMFEILPSELFRILDQALLFIVINLTKSVSTIMFSILSVVVLKRGAEGPLGASLIVTILFVIYYVYYLRDKIELNLHFSKIKECLKFGLPIVFLLLGRSLLDYTDRFILQWFVGLSIVGFYSVGSTVGSVLVMVAVSINSALMPFFFKTAKEESEAEAKEIFSYFFTYVGAAILFFGLCAVVFRCEIIYILAPPSYYSIIPVIPLIMIGAIMNSLFYIPVLGIYQEKKTIYLSFIIFVALIINIALNIILIPKFQMLGAALATAAASFIMLVSCFIISQKIYYIPYQYNRLFKLSVSCILCYVLSDLAQGYPLLASIIIKSFIVVIFPIFLYSARFFEPCEIEKIKHLISKFIKRVKPA